MQEIKFNYNVPILESATVDGEFLINGIAINATTTSNNHKFLPEVLRDSAQTLINVPLLTDHENMVENIKGRVVASFFDEIDENIKFKAVIKDSTIKQMIKDKLLNSVSVGAAVDPDDIEEEDGIITPKKITFKELSLVAIPADDGATFGIALKEAYDGFKSNSNPKGNVRGLTKMSDENKETEEEKPVEESESEPESKPEEPKEVSTEETEVEEKLKKVELALKKKRLAMLEKKLKEADVDEEKPKEEPKKEAKEEEEEEEEEADEVEESSDYKIVSEDRSFSMVKNKY